ncbi:MAG: helix-turn-helix transcriptional regulator [Verrucomicrobiota bacterium]
MKDRLRPAGIKVVSRTIPPKVTSIVKFPFGNMKSIRNVIGPQLRRIRYEKGMTQEALAAVLQRAGWDISRTSLAKIEAQLRWVADCELFILADVLGVRMEQLFPKRPEVIAFIASPDFKRN